MNPPRISTSSFSGAHAERGEDGEAIAKKIRREDSVATQLDEGESRYTGLDPVPSSPIPASQQQESEGVKEVTQGVKEVDISDKEDKEQPAPESVPLPADDDAAELQEPVQENTVSPPATEQKGTEPGATAADGDDDVASSVNDEDEQKKDAQTSEKVSDVPKAETQETGAVKADGQLESVVAQPEPTKEGSNDSKA
ncbi:hypothetical protein AX16_006767 [Volvariella volvacea WC 439]|nr:hypothetical protein AX16_006767 [Volvariella volvacea WC 439]